MAGEVLRRRVDGDVAAELERAHVQRSRRGRVADDAGGMGDGGLEVGHRQERVRRRLDPHEIDALGRRARLVELDLADAPASELVEHGAGPVVGAFCERDRLSR